VQKIKKNLNIPKQSFNNNWIVKMTKHTHNQGIIFFIEEQNNDFTVAIHNNLCLLLQYNNHVLHILLYIYTQK